MKWVASALLLWMGAMVSAASPPVESRQAPRAAVDPGSGEVLFASTCGFCHGRDASGGSGGPDLTASELVAQDVKGDRIRPLLRTGRPDKGMPPFALPEADVTKIVEFIHKKKSDADATPGRRRSVSAEDLSTGNVDAGRAFFTGPGGCATCHSPTGDLVGIASKYRGLALMQRMLYPTPQNAVTPPAGETRKPSSAKAAVTLPSGQTISGTLSYRDEFLIAVTDASGVYRSWPAATVKVSVTDPLQAHADLLPKYTDADIHNLFAYLQTIK